LSYGDSFPVLLTP